MFSHAVYGAGEDRRAVRHIYVSLWGVYSCRAFHTWDVDTDCDDNFQNGIQRIFEADADTRPGDAWGALGAWAFAASRICDWLQMQPQIDAGHIAVVGHSRGGKTALWCAAQDTRIFTAYASCSGCAGAAVTRGKKGERVAQITENFPSWFCRNYRRYAGCEEEMPFEQHMRFMVCRGLWMKHFRNRIRRCTADRSVIICVPAGTI